MSILLLLVFAALAQPASLVLQPGEHQRLTQGEVLVRPSGPSGELVGMVDVHAPFDRVWAAVMDFEARVRAVGPLKSVHRYSPADDPDGLAARYSFSLLGTELIYHLRYDVHRDEGWVSFHLDPRRDNDLLSSRGGYTVVDAEQGVRVSYWSTTDSGRPVPGFARRALAQRTVHNQLADLRAQAMRLQR